MSGKYTRRGQDLLASIEKIQDSFQMVNDVSTRDLSRKVSAIKRGLESIRKDFEREVKQMATTGSLVGRFGGVKKVKVAEMDAELARLRNAGPSMESGGVDRSLAAAIGELRELQGRL